MAFKDLLESYSEDKPLKKVIINGIEAEQVKDKISGELKGGTYIMSVTDDYIIYKVHNVTAESKTDKLTEDTEVLIIPIASINTLSEGVKDNTPKLL